MQFKELAVDDFFKFEQQHPDGSYMQTPAQREVLVQRSWQSQYMGVTDDDGKILAVELLNHRPMHVGEIFEVAGGPLIDYKDAALVKFLADETAAYAKAHKGLVLRWLPNGHTRAFGDDGQVVKEFDQTFITNLQAAGFKYQASKPVVHGEYSKVSLGYEFMKDLRGLTAETLEKSYTHDAQYGIKKTQQFGVKLRQLGYDELAEFKKYTDATAERRGFSDKTLDYYQKTFRAYGDAVQFIFAELNFSDYINEEQQKHDALNEQIEPLAEKVTNSPKNKRAAKQLNELKDQQKQHEKRIEDADKQRTQYGESVVLSGGMFFIQPQEIAYMFSFTNEEFKRYYAPYLIQNHMMHLAIEKGIPRYNFYGVTGLFDGTDGVLKFKQSFNGLTYETAGVFTRPVRPMTYKLVQGLKKLTGRD